MRVIYIDFKEIFAEDSSKLLSLTNNDENSHDVYLRSNGSDVIRFKAATSPDIPDTEIVGFPCKSCDVDTSQ